MRKITAPQISLFMLLLALTIALGVSTTIGLLWTVPLGDFRGVVMTVAGVIFIYLWAFLIYNLLLRVMPMGEGEIAEGSREEFAAQINILFYLLLFNSLIRTHFLPVPLMRLVYLALGARLGKNTYSAGVLLDPPLTHIGANCIIGHDAVLFAHAIEGRRLSLNAIHIDDNVTIGAMAVVMSDVKIGNGAIISAGAVLTKGSRVGPGEIWGGVPARLVKRAVPTDD